MEKIEQIILVEIFLNIINESEFLFLIINEVLKHFNGKTILEAEQCQGIRFSHRNVTFVNQFPSLQSITHATPPPSPPPISDFVLMPGLRMS